VGRGPHFAVCRTERKALIGIGRRSAGRGIRPVRADLRVVSMAWGLATAIAVTLCVPLAAQAEDPYSGPPGPAPGPPSNMTALAAVAIPALQRLADGGDVNAQCAILQLYVTGQAKPRGNDDLPAMHRTCAKRGYESSGQPPPPALLVRPVTIMLNLPGRNALVVEQPTDKQIADAGSSIPGGLVNGLVFVKCQIQKDGSLGGCIVPIEHPAGRGLADVGLGLAKLVRMTTEAPRGHSLVGLNVQVRIAFQDPGVPRP
jgi:hypothetical protein